MTDAPTTNRPGRVAVIVLGMHRSGTSSLAGMLDGLGCHGPATPMPKTDANAAGYFESLPVFRLNDAILTALRSRWDDWRPLRPDVHLSPRLAEFHDKARAVIEAEYGDGSLIYLKDPRISMLLPFWRGVLDAGGYRYVYLNIHRSPSEIAASLQRRDEIDPGLSLLTWLSQVLQAERHSRGQVRHFTSYEALLRDPAAVAMAAETAFGFPWPRPAEDGASRVNRALRHHDDGVRAVLEDARVPGLIRQTLEILERWAAQGEQAADHAQLDDIAAAFDEAEGLFAGAMQALRSRSAQLAPTRAREEALKTEKAALEAHLTQATKDKAMLDEHLTQITQARDEALRDCNTAREAQAEAEAHQARQQQELDMLTDRLTQITRARDEALRDRDTALATIRRETIAVTNRAAATEAARQQLEQSRKEAEALSGQLETQRQEFLSSTSWRVSAPVRALGRLIRRR
ncbi:hypothetical protein P775_01360 [Puniceibacterium antarcticum]|uniref:Sulfotransferase domain-containing protein n=2 Tax=Puniceibacterium antarcticum TaxID=1206336 RepID=A0A2G8RKE5_9RHOB|nr:hypothetical protein P775_01360 [Puniceibacterium antarcticum]